MSRSPYILLPPSESKEPGGRREAAPGFFDSALASPREAVRDALAATLAGASNDRISHVLNARGAHLERALAATRELIDETAPVLPAWRRYNGVVWSHLDPASLSPHRRRRILIPSGVYGLTRGTDPVADYRLTMKVSLIGLGSVSKFWRAALSPVLEDVTDAGVVSFLPREHAAVLGPDLGRARRLVTVSFVRHDGEGVAGHDAKAVKGVVARHVLHEGVESIEGFRWRGWRGTRRHDQYVVRAPRRDRGDDVETPAVRRSRR